MVLNALEPEWESRFEGSSYGFRPGRGCHDAIARIFCLVNPTGAKRWVIDADIKGAFDNINHDHLLNAVKNFPAKNLIQQWLEAGYIEGGLFQKKQQGTPQGGVISPLLANIALHGMEELLGINYGKGHDRKEYTVLRYADDFVVFCNDRSQSH